MVIVVKRQTVLAHPQLVPSILTASHLFLVVKFEQPPAAGGCCIAGWVGDLQREGLTIIATSIGIVAAEPSLRAAIPCASVAALFSSITTIAWDLRCN
jgi:hypothetical protein